MTNRDDVKLQFLAGIKRELRLVFTSEGVVVGMGDGVIRALTTQ